MFGLAVSLGPIIFACIWHWIKKKQEWKFRGKPRKCHLFELKVKKKLINKYSFQYLRLSPTHLCAKNSTYRRVYLPLFRLGWLFSSLPARSRCMAIS
jgi:hypothetical protein